MSQGFYSEFVDAVMLDMGMRLSVLVHAHILTQKHLTDCDMSHNIIAKKSMSGMYDHVRWTLCVYVRDQEDKTYIFTVWTSTVLFLLTI